MRTYLTNKSIANIESLMTKSNPPTAVAMVKGDFALAKALQAMVNKRNP